MPTPPDRRWLPARLIEDRYLTGTRLRLRRVSPMDGGTIEHKLGQKVRPDPGDPGTVLHTTMYLDPGEHARLAALPGADLRKVRHQLEHAGRRFSMDVFQGRHAGLVLLEVEVAEDDHEEVVPPPFAGPEVTGDERYTGGWLAAATPEALRSVM